MTRLTHAAEIGDDAAPTTAGGPAILSLVEPPPAGARARRLFEEARVISLEHLAGVAATMTALRDQLQTVVEAGELYDTGLHAFAERLSEDLFWRGKSFALLVERQRQSTEVGAVSKPGR